MNIYENPEKLERSFRKREYIYLAANCSRIQNWYQINAETKLVYSGKVCKLPNCHIHQY